MQQQKEKTIPHAQVHRKHREILWEYRLWLIWSEVASQATFVTSSQTKTITWAMDSTLTSKHRHHETELVPQRPSCSQEPRVLTARCPLLMSVSNGKLSATTLSWVMSMWTSSPDVEVFATKSDHWNFIPGTNIMERENWLPQIILWPLFPLVCCGTCVFTCVLVHTQSREVNVRENPSHGVLGYFH